MPMSLVVERKRRPWFVMRAAAFSFAFGSLLAVPRANAAPSACGFDLVEFRGVLGEHAEGALGPIDLRVGDRLLHVSVTAARRISGRPAEGPPVLEALGPGTPRLHVAGAPGLLEKLTAAAPGSIVAITGNVDAEAYYLTLTDATVSAPAAAAGATGSAAPSPRPR